MKRVLMILAIMTIISVDAGWTAENEQTLMDEVVVSAGRVEESKKDLTIGMTVINSEDIERSSASDLGDLLSEKGGIYIKKYPGALTSIAIRGFRTETHGNDLKGHVLVLLDGRRVATGNVAKISTENIERIEIIKGSAAVQYGSAAMGGLVNVITKKGEDRFSFFIDGGLGSYGFAEEGAGFSGVAGKFDFSASINNSKMDDYNTGHGDKYLNTGYDKKLSSSLNLGFEFLPKNRIGLIYTAFEADKIGNPNYITTNDPDNYKNTSNYSADLVYDGSFGDSIACKARYFLGEDKDAWHDPASTPSKKKTDSNGFQAQTSVIKDLFSATTGIDWLNYKISSSKYAPNKTEFENSAVFLLGKGKLLDKRLILSGGVRYDMYEVEVKKPAGNDEDDNNFSPTFGIAYNINDNIKIRSNYSKAFVMPAATELAADYATSYVWDGTTYTNTYVGNPELDPEISKTYEAGIDTIFKNFSSSLTVFTTKFEDKIQKAKTPVFENTWKNIGKATLTGVECEITGYIRNVLPFNLELKPYIVFTYLDEYEDEETDKDLEYISELDLSCGISLTDLDGFDADLSAAYVGSQLITDYQFKTSETIKLESVTTLNFTLSKKLFASDNSGDLTIRSEVKNITDETCEYVQGYPMPGRTFYLGFRYRY